MTEDKKLYRVTNDTDDAPLRDYLQHGYEERQMFYHAVQRLVERWHDRVGECIDSRNGFLLLRFHDTPGSAPDEEWLPEYLLKQVDAPACPDDSPPDEQTDSLNSIYGFN